MPDDGLPKLLGSFRASDVAADTPLADYSGYKERAAVRAVVFDDKKVALIRITKHGYYMLPGGGTDGEEPIAALKREVAEELGCEIAVEHALGSAEVYFDRWKQKQTDACYVARKMGKSHDRGRTEFEAGEGHEVVWTAGLNDAIALMEHNDPENLDGKLVRSRDLLFLKTARTATAQGSKP